MGNESDFTAAAERALNAIEAAIDACDADLESTRTGNVLTIELGDGSKIVVNSQAAMRQIWVAAKSGGYHYDWRDGGWRDTRDGSELFAALSRIISAQGRAAVLLRSG
jgi:CyaY protein